MLFFVNDIHFVDYFNGTFDFGNFHSKAFQNSSNVLSLSLSLNSFSGTIDWDTIASWKLYQFDWYSNEFCGSIDWDVLQTNEYVELLTGKRNNHNGSIDLTKLPPNLNTLRMYDNDFSGSLSFSNLPDGLLYLDVNNNPKLTEYFVDFNEIGYIDNSSAWQNWIELTKNNTWQI